MKIDVGRTAVEYIQKMGGVVSIDLYTTNSCCAGITEPVTNFRRPKRIEQFNEYHIDNVKIYVSKYIHLKGESLNIKLKSFMGIKNLTLSGIRML